MISGAAQDQSLCKQWLIVNPQLGRGALLQDQILQTDSMRKKAKGNGFVEMS